MVVFCLCTVIPLFLPLSFHRKPMMCCVVVKNKLKFQGEIKQYEVIVGDEEKNILCKNLQVRSRDQRPVGFVQLI